MRKLLNQCCRHSQNKGSVSSQLGKRGIQIVRKGFVLLFLCQQLICQSFTCFRALQCTSPFHFSSFHFPPFVYLVHLPTVPSFVLEFLVLFRNNPTCSPHP